jgi:hypothetical protein
MIDDISFVKNGKRVRKLQKVMMWKSPQLSRKVDVEVIHGSPREFGMGSSLGTVIVRSKCAIERGSLFSP